MLRETSTTQLAAAAAEVYGPDEIEGLLQELEDETGGRVVPVEVAG